MFSTTGLGKRQQQQQEMFAPSSFTRAKSGSSVDGNGAGAGAFSRIPSVCKEYVIPDGNGGHIISSRDWSLQTLYDCVGVPDIPLQVAFVVHEREWSWWHE